MRGTIFFTLLIVAHSAFAGEKSDSTKSPLQVSGMISLNSNGIAPIPAFALNKPAFSANLSFRKNRFSYDPQLSYGLNLKPWIIDNWFHYKLIANPSFELRTGINVSMFFSEYNTPNDKIWQGQRYTSFELAGFRKVTQGLTLGLMYWYDLGIEPETISGYFINFVADQSDIGIGKHLLLAANIQLFYIDYTDNNDGLFIAPKISFSLRKVPLSLFAQGIQALISNISPYPSFQWNIGIGYSF